MGMGITHVLNLTKEIPNEFEEEGIIFFWVRLIVIRRAVPEDPGA
jgi:hypothetical protein